MMISVGMLRDVWAFRDFMWSSVKREFQSRWTGTQFGPVWIVLQPLANILIFTVIFAQIMKPSLPNHASKFAYSIYLCSGVLTWNFFCELLTRSVNIFVENANLLKKIHFPKLCLPFIVLLSSSLNFAIVLSIFLGFLLVIGSFPGWIVLYILPIFFLQVAFSIGLGVLLSTINVFYRDVNQTVQVILQFWFWLTPIVYVSFTPSKVIQTIHDWNPMYAIIHAYQGIFLEQVKPQWPTLVYPSLMAVFFVLLGILSFYKLQGEIVDEL
jgi:lipopolysaccharide transport system permease protein